MLTRLTALSAAAGLLLAATAAGASGPTTLGGATAAKPQQCRDQKGHFTACAKPVAATATRCRTPAGQFTKCPSASGMAALGKPALKK